MKFEWTKSRYSRQESPWAKPIESVSAAQMQRALRNKPTVCILTAADGSYVQVGRHGFCCCLEWRDTKTGRHLRGFQHPPVVPWPGVSSIVLLAGTLSLMQEEYFNPQQVAEALMAFLEGQPFPSYIQWRDITAELKCTNS